MLKCNTQKEPNVATALQNSAIVFICCLLSVVCDVGVLWQNDWKIDAYPGKFDDEECDLEG